MSKRICLLLFFFSLASIGAIRENFHLQANLEQINLPITKTFSIRAKSINYLTVKSTKSITIKEIYLEFSDGTFLVLDMKKMNGEQIGKWSLSKKHIKTITFTARTNSISHNKLEFVLTR